ncbi:MAG: glycosyltransferase family 4 protein, partial [Chloroflexi bacterium]
MIAAAGLLEPRKRFGLMIDRLAPLLSSGKVSLLIAGAGPEASSLHALADRMKIGSGVRLLGHI